MPQFKLKCLMIFHGRGGKHSKSAAKSQVRCTNAWAAASSCFLEGKRRMEEFLEEMVDTLQWEMAHGGQAGEYRRSVLRGVTLYLPRNVNRILQRRPARQNHSSLTFSARLRSPFDSPLFASDDILKRVCQRARWRHQRSPRICIFSRGSRRPTANSRKALCFSWPTRRA